MNDLINIKGIGDKTILLLNKLGIYSINDLVMYFPFRYEILKRSDINRLIQDDKIIIDGIILNVPNVFYIKRKLTKMTFTIQTMSHILNIVIFNRSFIKNNLTVGKTVTVIGKYDKKNNTILASNIRFEGLGNTTKIEPIYRTTSNLTNKQIKKYINEALLLDLKFESIIPDYLITKYKFLSKKESVNTIHNPTSSEKFKRALAYLKYEELFLFMLRINILKNNKKNETGLKRNVRYSEIEKFIDKLSFKLTSDQQKSIREIYNDLTSDKRMNRLLQGDVGSGKTIVSFIALYINFLSGYQGALMAPTEILATQHFKNIINIFADYDIKISLLT